MKQSNGQVNEKVLQLLMQVAVNDEPVTAKQLSDQVGTPISSLYRHIKLLKEWNLIEESPSDKTLIIGPAALMLMRSYKNSQHDLDAVDLVLNRLQKQTGEMSAYMVPVGYRALCVSRKRACRRFVAVTSRVKVNPCCEAPHPESCWHICLLSGAKKYCDTLVSKTKLFNGNKSWSKFATKGMPSVLLRLTRGFPGSAHQ